MHNMLNWPKLFAALLEGLAHLHWIANVALNVEGFASGFVNGLHCFSRVFGASE